MNITQQLAKEFNVNETTLIKAIENLEKRKAIFITFSGKIGSGKDTVAPILLKSLDVKTIHHEFFARALKEEVQRVFDLLRMSETKEEAINAIQDDQKIGKADAEKIVSLIFDEVRENLELTSYNKTKNVRTALQYWGTEVRRKQNDNYWVNLTMNKAVNHLAKEESVYVTDSRFVNEISAVAILGGFSVRLDVSPEEQLRRINLRDNVVVTEEARNHPSETILDSYDKFDVRVSTDDLTPEEISNIILERLETINGLSSV